MAADSSSEIRVAAYLRATAAELARGRRDVDEERRRIERHAEKQGWKLVAVFDETGAGPGSTPMLDAALERAGEWDKIVVLSLERLGRRPREVEELVERLEATGVDLVAIDEGIDTATETGKALRKMLAQVVSWLPHRYRGTTGWHPTNLSRHDFSPATVIDVGAAGGTPPLLETFPEAHHVLIEPLAEYAQDLERVLERYEGEYVQAAVGGEEGRATIFIDPAILMSSLLRPREPRPSAGEREVSLTTLDRLLEERRWTPPFGLKLDAEGFEGEIVRGAAKVLERTEFVICEVAISSRFEGDCTARELIPLLRSAGFELVDLLDAARGPLGPFADVLFTRPSRPS